MNGWVATFGIKQPKGGWLVTEQAIVEAVDYPTAFKCGIALCPRGESVMDVQLIHEDRDPLDYDNIDVI
jgi:hypothetical protein